MKPAIDRAFRDWTEGKDPVAARVAVFERIRDIPYAIIPRLIDAEHYVDILREGKGSCTPKHLLLAAIYERLGLHVLLAVYPFRWADVDIDLPHSLRRRADALPPDHHLACKVEIDGLLVLVDATVDPPLERLGLPVNMAWDGMSETILPVMPSGEERIYHPLEARYINNVFIDDAHLAFFDEFNGWLDRVRSAFPG